MFRKLRDYFKSITGSAILVMSTSTIYIMVWIVALFLFVLHLFIPGNTPNAIAVLGIIVIPIFLSYFVFKRYVLTLWAFGNTLRIKTDSSEIVPVQLQPAVSSALNAGEQVVLERSKTPEAVRRSLVNVSVFLLIFALLSVLCATSIVPRLSLVSIYNHRPPNGWGWYLLLYPLALILLLGPRGIIDAVRYLPTRIIANDDGISFGTARRNQFVRWQDIQLLFCERDAPFIYPANSYALWTNDHIINFTIFQPIKQKNANQQRKERPSEYVYPGGYDAYRMNAERLLATICVRSGISLGVSPKIATAARRLERWDNRGQIQPKDLLDLPLAPPALQPDPFRAPSNWNGEIALQAEYPRSALFGVVILSSIIAFGILWLLTLKFISPSVFIHGSASRIIDSIAVSIVCLSPLLALFIGFVVAVMRQQWAMRPIVANDQDCSQMNITRTRTYATISWAKIRVWAVKLPPAGSSKPVRYFLVSENQIMTWSEPQHARVIGASNSAEREAVYRRNAAQLHSFIAELTNLPLRIYK